MNRHIVSKLRKALLLLGIGTALIFATGCGANLGSPAVAAYSERGLIRGAETYVAVSDDALAKIDLAGDLIRELAEPHIVAKLDTVDLYFSDDFYLDDARGYGHDGVALPLGSRVVLLREFVEARDFVTIATLYVHELHHMSQTVEFVGTPEGEIEARQAELRFRETCSAFESSDGYATWLAEHAPALAA